MQLEFSVERAEALAYAALPTIVLKLHIATASEAVVRGMALTVQVRIAATQRAYLAEEQLRLLDVFGEPSRWGQTLKSLLWTNVSLNVPSFSGATTLDLAIPCTYDFEVISTKYCDALESGSIPLDLLFSGTLFYAGEHGLQAEQIPWDREARFGLPVSVWNDVMRLYFPNTAWLRLHKDTFDRLREYRTRHALPSWESALERLLDAETAWTR